MNFKLIIYSILLFLPFNIFSQSIDTSKTYVSEDEEKNIIVLNIHKVDTDVYYLSIKTIDTSFNQFDISSGDYNINALIQRKYYENINQYKILLINDLRIDSIEINNIDNKLKLVLFKKIKLSNSSSKDIFSSPKSIVENINKTTKIIFVFSQTKVYSFPIMNNYCQRFDVFNFKRTIKNLGVNFYEYPFLRAKKQEIKFKPNEAIIITETLFSKENSRKYLLSYIKAKSNITEGKYNEYSKHLWIDVDDLKKYFRYQK